MKNIEYGHIGKTITLLFVWAIFMTLNSNLYGQTLYSKSIPTSKLCWKKNLGSYFACV